MIYTLVGAPGTKEDVALRLREFLNEGECADSCFKIVQDEAHESTGGFLADYRVELMLATQRACKKANDDNVIFTHSLVDSTAYAALRLSGLLNEDPNSPNLPMWGVTFDACLGMLIDGWKSDVTLFVPYKGEDEDARDLSKALTDILDSLPINYTEIDPDAEVGTWLTK